MYNEWEYRWNNTRTKDLIVLNIFNYLPVYTRVPPIKLFAFEKWPTTIIKIGGFLERYDIDLRVKFRKHADEYINLKRTG